MSAQDLRDVMGLTGDVARPPPLKKQKMAAEKQALEKGMAREVAALMGERGPPISMIPVQPRFKQRPRRSHRAAPWILEPFANQARDDNLLLYHWARKQVAKPKHADSTASEPDTAAAAAAAAANTAAAERSHVQSHAKEDYKFAKFNVSVDAPEYSDELYNAQLQDPDWTKEETDYLVDLVKEYGQKWAVVVDRYDFKPTKTEDGAEVAVKQRSMEYLKQRYYNVRAKVLAHNIPISSMNLSDYALYQTLQSYNPSAEMNRKKLAQAHLCRSPAEVDEETALLAELQRIMINQQRLENERKEIRDRLEFPIATTNASAAQYSSSTALAALFQQLLQADRMKKDRKFKNLPDQTNQTPSSAPSANAPAATSAHRDSISTNTAPRKSGARDSLAGSADGSRPLNAHAEQRFFITHHDRLSSGVSFASDKLHKPRLAKSAIQTERIAATLAHLQIPEIIPLPTQKVIEEFEKLMQKVHVLLDMRKVAEKEEQEIKVRQAEHRIKGEKAGGVSVKEERRPSLAVREGGDAASGSGQTAGQKRGASVMSESTSGQTSSKRPKA
ncbi:hypothetical protein AAFC00_002683 [Neodothiora populina]|uniref:SWR1-complex protein 4 n=1 Tax=Neodothiora populina TaxID=2781224 RepID=A0ABR3P7X5_9PEZI